MAKKVLVVGPQQSCVGAVKMAKSAGVFAVVAPKLVANGYPSGKLPNSSGGVANLGGTEATNVRLNNGGQIY